MLRHSLSLTPTAQTREFEGAEQELKRGGLDAEVKRGVIEVQTVDQHIIKLTFVPEPMSWSLAQQITCMNVLLIGPAGHLYECIGRWPSKSPV